MNCKYGDPLCPCQDGDACHYEGDNAWPPPEEPHFDGATYDPEQDQQRLSAHLEKVRAFATDQGWRTLQEVAQAAGCSESSAGARLRDLRKSRFGSYKVESKRISKGLWKYRVTPK